MKNSNSRGSPYPAQVATQTALAAAQTVQALANTNAMNALDMSGVSSAALHRSPNAINATFVYDTSKDSDGGAWIDRCTNTSWFNEALTPGTWLPGGFVGEMDARDYFGSYQAASLITGDSSNFSNGVGSWTPHNGNSTAISINGRLRVTLTATVGNTPGCAIPITTVIGQRYQISLEFITANAGNQNLFVGVGSAPANNTLGSLNMTTGLGTRRLTFVAAATLTYINIYGSSAWAQNSFAEIDDITVKPVSFATNPSGSYYQLTTDGKFYRLWQNLLSNSGFTGGTSGTFGSGAVAPTGWQGTVGNGSITIQTSTTPTRPGNSIRYQATAQRPQLYQIVALPAGVSAVFSVYVETLTSGTPQIRDIVLPSPVPSGATVTYRKNGAVANSTDTVTTSDFIEAIVTTTTSSGNCYFQHGLGCTANITADITLSPCQAEIVSPSGLATAYEPKAVGVGAQSETFRGNSAKFPRLSAIVCEATTISVTIYDLTVKDRPMWGRWSFSGTLAALTHVVAGQGRIYQASTSGLVVLDFAADRLRWQQSGNDRIVPSLTNHTSPSTGYFSSLPQALIASNTVNVVSMCVLPDAPVDAATGLQIPTVALATGSGLNLLHNDGVVRTSQAVSAFTSVVITKDLLTAGITNASTSYTALRPGTLGASFVVSTVSPAQFAFNVNAAQTQGLYGRSMIYRRGNALALLRHNEAVPGDGITANINYAHNTGWLVGDIRRCWAADTFATPLTPGSNIVTNGSFDADTSGWNPIIATVTWESGTMKIVHGSVAGAGRAVTTTPPGRLGKAYRVQMDLVELYGDATGVQVLFGDQNGNVAANAYSTTVVRNSGPGALDGMLTLLPGTNLDTAYVSIAVLGGTFAGGGGVRVDNLVITEVAPDKSYNLRPATIYGTITRNPVATGAQLVSYSGFSAANYLQEAVSAQLDFGTGAWTCAAWVNIPATLPVANFPLIGAAFVANDLGAAPWQAPTSGSVTANIWTGMLANATVYVTTGLTIGKTYRLISNSNIVGGNWNFVSTSGTIYTAASGPRDVIFQATSTDMRLIASSIGSFELIAFSVQEVTTAVITERDHSSGPSIRLGCDGVGRLVAVAYDGTTTRTVTSTVAYNTAIFVHAAAIYDGAGRLSLLVNGRPAATTYGTPLLTMNNVSAVTTIGNSRALDAPFPGSLAFVKWSATLPTLDAAAWIYEQEKEMFYAGAQITLPSATTLIDASYDDFTDTLSLAHTGIEANFKGLIRTSAPLPLAGVFSKITRGSGVKLTSRITTAPGVDVTLPGQNIRDEFRKSDDAGRRAKSSQTFEFIGGFTATVTINSNALTSVANLNVPASVNLRGVTVTGTGIPASTVITDIVGTTIYLSKIATATNAGVNITFKDFPLPVGYEATRVTFDGTNRRETTAWSRSYDGFVEKETFVTEPGVTAWVMIDTRKT